MLLLEISNNAIETMIKKRYPKLHKFMDLSTEDLQYQPNSLGINENTPKMKVKDFLESHPSFIVVDYIDEDTGDVIPILRYKTYNE